VNRFSGGSNGSPIPTFLLTQVPRRVIYYKGKVLPGLFSPRAERPIVARVSTRGIPGKDRRIPNGAQQRIPSLDPCLSPSLPMSMGLASEVYSPQER
jgi:hypothetical protein